MLRWSSDGKLSDYAIKVLRTFNGEDMRGVSWGNSLQNAYRVLVNDGFIKPTTPGNGVLTEKGLTTLREAGHA